MLTKRQSPEGLGLYRAARTLLYTRIVVRVTTVPRRNPECANQKVAYKWQRDDVYFEEVTSTSCLLYDFAKTFVVCIYAVSLSEASSSSSSSPCSSSSS